MKCPYKTLNVTRTATREQIKRAFRLKAQKVHPDRNPSPNAGNQMRALLEAWNTLRNPARRATWDAATAPQPTPRVTRTRTTRTRSHTTNVWGSGPAQPEPDRTITGHHRGALHVAPGETVRIQGFQDGPIHAGRGSTVYIDGRLRGVIHADGASVVVTGTVDGGLSVFGNSSVTMTYRSTN